MCGIVGYMQFRGLPKPDLPRLVQTARDRLSHRGPDDAGLYASVDGLCVLGHRRLSILDLTLAGHQPMSNEDGTLWIVFNGEIYNFVKLREELQRKGHRFRSRSDTEVILHLFEEEGPPAVRRLDGEFAFVLYDSKTRRLFGARDPLGVKPLYFALSPTRFAFASEPKALLALPDVSPAPRVEEFPGYLTFNCVPGPNTLCRDIQKLEPGTLFELTAEGSWREERFWTPGPDPDMQAEGAEDLLQLLRERLYRATEKRMISDVPFGAMLSGGVDSSLTVAFMTEALQVPVATFTVGYPGEEADPNSDLIHARLVARTFGTDHHEVILSEGEILEALDELPRLADDPIGAPSVTANLHLARFARRSGITVAQVGEGADEVFCGYQPVHRFWQMRERLGFLGTLLRPGLARRVGRRLEPLAAWFGDLSLTGTPDGTVAELLRRYSNGEHLYWGYGVLLNDAERYRLFGGRRPLSDPYEQLRRRTLLVERFPQLPLLDQLTLIDLLLGLPERLLMRVDKATMLFGLEARVPFLDPGVVRAAFRVPPRVRAPEPKGFLKQLARTKLPPEILARPKVGFPTAQGVFLAPRVFSRLRDSVLDSRFLDLTGLDRRRVAELFAQPENGRSRYFYQAWSLYVLSLWFHHWVEGRGD
jgi:asparagine synthase (glutamine-hydrolysing)